MESVQSESASDRRKQDQLITRASATTKLSNLSLCFGSFDWLGRHRSCAFQLLLSWGDSQTPHYGGGSVPRASSYFSFSQCQGLAITAAMTMWEEDHVQTSLSVGNGTNVPSLEPRDLVLEIRSSVCIYENSCGFSQFKKDNNNNSSSNSSQYEFQQDEIKWAEIKE